MPAGVTLRFWLGEVLCLKEKIPFPKLTLAAALDKIAPEPQLPIFTPAA